MSTSSLSSLLFNTCPTSKKVLIAWRAHHDMLHSLKNNAIEACFLKIKLVMTRMHVPSCVVRLKCVVLTRTRMSPCVVLAQMHVILVDIVCMTAQVTGASWHFSRLQGSSVI
eukprot:1136169-Pelagomonas_calceolata.AAC.7